MAQDSSEASRQLSLSPGIQQLKNVLDKPYVSLRQVGDLLGVKYNTVAHWVRDGKLNALRVGGKWRVYEQELRDFLKLSGYLAALEEADAQALKAQEATHEP